MIINIDSKNVYVFKNEKGLVETILKRCKYVLLSRNLI